MPRNEFGSPGPEECHAGFPRDVPAESTNPLLGPGGIAENQKNTKKDSNVLLFRKPGRTRRTLRTRRQREPAGAGPPRRLSVCTLSRVCVAANGSGQASASLGSGDAFLHPPASAFGDSREKGLRLLKSDLGTVF